MFWGKHSSRWRTVTGLDFRFDAVVPLQLKFTGGLLILEDHAHLRSFKDTQPFFHLHLFPCHISIVQLIFWNKALYHAIVQWWATLGEDVLEIMELHPQFQIRYSVVKDHHSLRLGLIPHLGQQCVFK